MVYYAIIAVLFMLVVLFYMLGRSAGKETPFPIRMGEEDLSLSIKNLSEISRVTKGVGGVPRVRGVVRRIARAYRTVCRKVDAGEEIFESEKWLYENFHSITLDVSARDYKEFATLTHNGGAVRIMSLARLIVSANRCDVDRAKIVKYVGMFNGYTPLRHKEVCHLHAAFRLALLEQVATVADKIVLTEKMRRHAREDKEPVAKYCVYDSYLYFFKRFGKYAGTRKFIRKNEIDESAIELSFRESLLGDCAIVSQAVRSLKTLSDVFDNALILELSPMNALMRKDVVYEHMDDLSKTSYLNACARLAQLFGATERGLVLTAFELAEKYNVHFGDVIFNNRYALKAALHTAPPEILARSSASADQIVYITAVCVVTALLTAIGVLFTPGIWMRVLTGVCLAVSAIAPAQYVVTRVFSYFLPPRAVHRMNYAQLPAEGRTLVVLSEFIAAPEQAREAADKLRAVLAVNRDENIAACLLADYPASAAQTDERDAAIDAALREAAGDDICVLVRKRTLCGKVWKGYERKRGAIEALNNALISDNFQAFSLVVNRPQKPEFVLLLDDDSELLPGAVRLAANTLLHPLNGRYELMTFNCAYKRRSITDGYAKLYAAQSGIETYCAYSDFFYNLCGHSVYCGKGIYRLERFTAALGGKIPEGRVLSHDILEGAIASTGSLGIGVYEDAPQSLTADVARAERWLRGDLLLAPFARKKYCSQPIYGFVMIANIVSAFAPVAAAALWLTAFITQRWILLLPAVISTLLVPLFEIGYILLETGAVRVRYVLADLGCAFVRALWQLIALPFYALDHLYVALATLWRMAFRRDKLLEWKTFRQVSGARGFARHAAMCLPTAALMLALAGAFYTSLPMLAYAFAVIVGVNAVYLCGKKTAPRRALKEDDRAFLRAIAEDTCRYYERMFAEKTLLADNLQIFPEKGVSKNTSPTNLGFGTVYPVCAHALGRMDREAALAAIEKSVETTEKLPKWNGLPFNWYDAQTAQPVQPYFVSSVDCGNWLGCLITAERFCAKEGADGLAARLKKLIESADLRTLYDAEKRKFRIGYNVADRVYEGYYDMLASESRLLAYIGSCLFGDTACWRALSRLTVRRGGNTLVSWSGTAFEYLMPQLFLPDVEGTLVTQSVRRAARIIARNKCRGVWGISESGYYDFDAEMNYQYRAFGTSALSLRSTPDSCVVSPYSAALALPYLPVAATDNLRRLAARGLRGEYGMYEAIDYTSGSNVVASYMSHHQGMALCAYVNFLCGDCLRSLFMDDPAMAGGRLLLEEKPERGISKRRRKADFVYRGEAWEDAAAFVPDAATRPVALLAGGGMTTVIDSYGCGFSKSGSRFIGKYDGGLYADNGAFVYLEEDGSLFCPTYAPLRDGAPEHYRMTATPEKCVFENPARNVSLEVCVSALESCEVRRLTVRNNTDRIRRLRVAYFLPLSLADWGEQHAHPCFADLFVSTEFDEENALLTARRRTRDGGEDCRCALHARGLEHVRAESNIANFLGRNGAPSRPAVFRGAAAEVSVGDVLDPCLGMTGEIAVLPGGEEKILFVTVYGTGRDAFAQTVSRVCKRNAADFGLLFSAISGEKARKYLRDPQTFRLSAKIASHVLYRRYDRDTLRAFAAEQTPLPYGLGIERKYLLTQWREDDERAAARQILAVIYCNLCGVSCDLALVYRERDTYNQSVLRRIAEQTGISDLETLGFIRPIAESALGDEDFARLARYAFLDLRREVPDWEVGVNTFLQTARPQYEKLDPPELFRSGSGGFDAAGDYYVTSVPPVCYSNVVCARKGGFVATENGGGFTYFGNSYADKFTRWYNRPVTDEPSERLLIADGMSVFRANRLCEGGFVRHAKGVTQYLCRVAGVRYETEECLAKDGAVKLWRVRCANRSGARKTLACALELRVQLGAVTGAEHCLFTEKDGELLRIVNAVNGQTVFLRAPEGGYYPTDADYCRNPSDGRFRGIMQSKEKSYNPAFAACAEFALEAGEEKEIVFAASADAQLLRAMSGRAIDVAATLQREYFASLAPVALESGDRALDLLYANLPYQIVSSRLNGRCGYYQVGGAIGFRDQLQDCLALMYSDPAAVAEHILVCAEHQYLEGDVMHWWHPPRFGVRTRITDDKLFLVYVTCAYIDATGDQSILDRRARYLVGAPLEPLREARLEHGKLTDGGEPLLCHLQRALDSVACGEHGLALIGGGDWNDALNDIGLRGRGESVWLTMFAAHVTEKFAALLEGKEGDKYRERARALRDAAAAAFETDRFKRAFTDDGEWLGAESAEFMKIDLLSQSWAVLAEIGSKQMRKTAWEAAKRLVDEERGIVKLLDPPFGNGRYYGYISDYPRGVRENGGQYTHGAVWYLAATAALGEKAYANKLLRLLNPAEKCRDPQAARIYKGEPYVLAADVYANPDHYGRMGWSWYTGSAAWLYTVITEQMLGLRLQGGGLSFRKPLLEGWEAMRLTYRYEDTVYAVDFARGEEDCLRIGGVNYKGALRVPLKKNAGLVRITAVFA